MKSQHNTFYSSSGAIHVFSWVYFGAFMAFSLSNFTERFMLDASVALFEIVNNKTFFLPVYRLGTIFNQLLPWIGAKLDAPLDKIVLLYHINDVVWYILFYALLTLLRQQKLILVMLLGHFIGAKGLFFMISFEGLLVWPIVVLYYAILFNERFMDAQPMLKFGLLTVLTVPIIWCHLLLTAAFLFIGAYVVLFMPAFGIGNRLTRFLIGTTLLLLFVRLISLPQYDVSHINHSVAPIASLSVASVVAKYLYVVYHNTFFFLVLLPIAVVSTLLGKNRVLKAIFLFVLGMLMVSILYLYELDNNKLLLPFILVAIFLVSINWNHIARYKYIVLFACLFLFSLWGENEVLGYHKRQVEQRHRSNQIMEVLALAKPNSINYIVLEKIPDELLVLRTVLDCEFLIQSCIEPPYVAKSITLTAADQVPRLMTFSKDTFDLQGKLMSCYELDSQYFKLLPLGYRELIIPEH